MMRRLRDSGEGSAHEDQSAGEEDRADCSSCRRRVSRRPTRQKGAHKRIAGVSTIHGRFPCLVKNMISIRETLRASLDGSM
jgi:hypothetical protein